MRCVALRLLTYYYTAVSCCVVLGVCLLLTLHLDAAITFLSYSYLPTLFIRLTSFYPSSVAFRPIHSPSKKSLYCTLIIFSWPPAICNTDTTCPSLLIIKPPRLPPPSRERAFIQSNPLHLLLLLNPPYIPTYAATLALDSRLRLGSQSGE